MASTLQLSLFKRIPCSPRSIIHITCTSQAWQQSRWLSRHSNRFATINSKPLSSSDISSAQDDQIKTSKQDESKPSSLGKKNKRGAAMLLHAEKELIMQSKRSLRQGYLFRDESPKSCNYHPIDLRNACKCPKCVNPSDQQKNYSSAEVPVDIEVKDFRRDVSAKIDATVSVAEFSAVGKATPNSHCRLIITLNWCIRQRLSSTDTE